MIIVTLSLSLIFILNDSLVNMTGDLLRVKSHLLIYYRNPTDGLIKWQSRHDRLALLSHSPRQTALISYQ